MGGVLGELTLIELATIGTTKTTKPATTAAVISTRLVDTMMHAKATPGENAKWKLPSNDDYKSSKTYDPTVTAKVPTTGKITNLEPTIPDLLA